jgi:hypothetical protein
VGRSRPRKEGERETKIQEEIKRLPTKEKRYRNTNTNLKTDN